MFITDDDYYAYLGWLEDGAVTHGCAVHAYVLMTNHIHLLVTPETRESISRMIQFVGRKYVTYFNHEYSRTGTLWEGRHKGCLVSDEEYFLACSRYIEMNPVRVGIANVPGVYRWSSYPANAYGKACSLIDYHTVYKSLGDTSAERQMQYRELFRPSLDPPQIHDIRTSAQTGTPLGNDLFRNQIERALKCKVGYAARRNKPGQRAIVSNITRC